MTLYGLKPRFQGLLRQVRDVSAPTNVQQPPLFPETELFPFGANAPARPEHCSDYA